MTIRKLSTLAAATMALSLGACGINSVPTAEEAVNAAWGNVEAEYQRRNDLIGNLVESVKAAAGSEEDILTQITEARASATSANLSADQLDNPEAVRAYAEAQGQLSNARSLLGTVIMERYPELQSQQRFADLMVQLEGTENSILVARRASSLGASCANGQLVLCLLGSSLDTSIGRSFQRVARQLKRD